MLNKIKSKLTLRNILLLSSLVVALVDWIIYLVVATTGYFAGKAPDAAVVTLTIFYFLGVVAFLAFDDRFKKFDTLFFFALAAFLILAFVFFVLDKEEVVGERLIPVNHPQKQIDAAVSSIVGIIFYLISFILFAVSSFFADKKKEKTPAVSE